jgi:hypothetical protein
MLVSLILMTLTATGFTQLSDQQMFLKGVEAYKKANYADARKLFFTTLKN